MNFMALWHRFTGRERHAAAEELLKASNAASCALASTAAAADESITRMETRLVERRALPRVKTAQG